MLAAVAYSAERLLLSSDWRDAIDDVLMHLGVAAGVSRAYLIEVGTLETGFRATQLAEWCAPGVASQFENPTLRGTPLAEAGFSRWIELMSSRATVHGVISEFPEEERLELAKQDIRSIAAFPVFVDGDWWAFIGFDDCVDDREWTAFELDSLRAAAGVLGAAEQADRADARRRHAEVRYQRLVEQNPAVTYMESHDPEGGRLTFVSPQLQDLLGYAPEVPLGDRDWWWGHVHPDDRDAVQVANRTAFSRGTAVRPDVPDANGGRNVGLGAGRGSPDPGRRRPDPVLAGLPRRRDRTRRDRGAAPRGRGTVPGDGRADPGGDLHGSRRRRRRDGDGLREPADREHPRVSARTVPGAGRPVVRGHASRRPRPSPRDRRLQQLRPRAVRTRVSDASRGRSVGVGARHLDGGPGRGRGAGLLPRVPDRCELSTRCRGAPPRGGAHVPHDGRAEPGGLLHPVHRSRRSDEVAHAVRRTRRREADGRPGRSDDRRSRSVAIDGPPGRPEDGASRPTHRAIRTARTGSPSSTA